MANTFTSSDFSFELSKFLFISYHLQSDIHELDFQHVTETDTINAAIGKKDKRRWEGIQWRRKWK